MMKKSEIITALEPVIKTFDELGILYYMTGSLVSSSYGLARATYDVDLVSNLLPAHILPLTTKLKDKYYIDPEMIADAIKAESSFNILHLESMLKIDIFIYKEQPYYQKVMERKIKDKLEEDSDAIQIFLCSPEDVILNKLLWYKSGGEVSEQQWKDIMGVIKVQDQNLDNDYLKVWAEQLELIDLLEKSFSELNKKL